VFVVIEEHSGELRVSYPAERIDFDPTGVPANILHTFEEAVTCEANACYTAAAIMVRKTLEVLCDDRQATGKDLKERVAALCAQATLPVGLLEGLDQLRLLGNDAAHVESKSFDGIGQDEVAVAIAIVKEVLKAIYQMVSIVNKLKALKKPASGGW
jgi:hypothetical protein